MAKTYIKFPTAFFASSSWKKQREYSKAEALLYLLNDPQDTSVRWLAKVFQWSKTSVSRFLAEVEKNGYLSLQVGHKMGQKWDTFVTHNDADISELQTLLGQKWDKSGTQNGTHLIENNITPLSILSTTNVVSNISIPPKGMSESNNSDFLKFQQWIKDNAPRVGQMKEPFTAEQFASLKTDFDTNFICALLQDMHNYDSLTKKNRSAYLTFRNWARRRNNQDNGKSKPTTNTTSDPSARLGNVLRAVAEGISRANTPQDWQS